jgi:Ca2+-binding EF-hand superfamily protein
MSNKINKSSQYKEEIKKGFKSYSQDDNEIIETKQLNDINKITNLNQKNPFLYNSIKNLVNKKSEENDEYITSKEYINNIDEQLNDINTKEGIEHIFNVFCDEKKEGFSWTKLVLTAKELGDDENAKNLLKLIEQAKLLNKEINFEEFNDIINEDNDNEIKNNIKSLNESDEYEKNEKYKKIKIKEQKKDEEEEEEMKTLSSKNEEINQNENEKTKKRYHRRYRDTKNNYENNNNTNNVNSKIHTKYRKKNNK